MADPPNLKISRSIRENDGYSENSDDGNNPNETTNEHPNNKSKLNNKIHNLKNIRKYADMENVMSVSSAARVKFLSWGKILALIISCFV